MSDNAGTAQSPEELYPDARFKEMVEAGVLYGRKKTNTHPRMKQYVALNRNGIEIIDLTKTLEQLEQALSFVRHAAAAGKKFLLVATQPAAEAAAAEFSREFSIPFVTRRWAGGMLTNFKVLSKRIEYFKKLKTDRVSGKLDKYTKKERIMFEREITRLEGLFGGVETMTDLPDALIILDPRFHKTAVREARRLRIPIIAFADVDSEPDSINYLVVGNTRARASIAWFLGKMREAIREGKSRRAVAPPSTSSGEEVPADSLTEASAWAAESIAKEATQ